MITTMPLCRSSRCKPRISFWFYAVCLSLSVMLAIGGSDQLIGEQQKQPGGQAESKSQSGNLALWLVDNQAELNGTSDKLYELLALRVGPDIQASSDYHDFKDIKLEESLEAWRLLHRRSAEYALNQVRFYGPRVLALLREANVTTSCSLAVERYLSAAGNLDTWAVQMWSSTGNFPPVGLLDGQFTDLGSYRGCVDVLRPYQATESTDSEDKGGSVHMKRRYSEMEPAGSYCLVGFRPIIPSRTRFHQIFRREDARLGQLFVRGDVFERGAYWAQYFHYLYLKTGVCVPVECTAFDIRRVTSLVGQRLALMSAPVKCFTRVSEPETLNAQRDNTATGALQISLVRKLNRTQLLALLLVGLFFSLVTLATIWHALVIVCSWLGAPPGTGSSNSARSTAFETSESHLQGLRLMAFEYFSILSNLGDYLDTSVRRNEIKCLHGLRVLTMIWIICVHTLQYNDWSGFSRVFENEASLQNIFVHPLINANYVVDNFFLMSGLLAAYTIWLGNCDSGSSKQAAARGSQNFSVLTSLCGRYLRLTPQVLLISLLNILLPLINSTGGPFWHDMTHQAAENCQQNWWVNLLHIQAFYRRDQMCNLVGWWISVDMFYYIIGLVLLGLILRDRLRLAFGATFLLVSLCMWRAAWIHFTGGFTPNNLATVPQIGEVWTEFVVNFFWSPYPHAPAFFLGLWLGFILATRRLYHWVRANSRLGWCLAIPSLVAVNMSSRLWITGTLDLEPEWQALSTSYNIICVLVWAAALGWTIVACQYGCAPYLNELLAAKPLVLLSKSSFIIYLSHMLVVRAYYGSQNNLLEVSLVTLLAVIISIVVISIVFGIFLHVAFESPCLKFHQLVLRKLRGQYKSEALTNVGAQTNFTNDVHKHTQLPVMSLGDEIITHLFK